MRLNISSQDLLHGLLSMPVTKENAVQPTDIWNRRISYSDRAKTSTISGITTLRGWVEVCSSEAVRETVEYVRSISDDGERKKAKEGLPMCFPSAVLSTRDKNVELSEKVLSYSGIIGLDFDFHNSIQAEAAVEDLRRVPYVAFVGLSVSGQGVYGFAATDNTDYTKHKLYWRAVSDDIAERTGYENDEQTKDATHGRYLSYNPYPIVNETVVPFSLPEGYEEKAMPINTPGAGEDFPPDDTIIAAVADCVRQWEERGIFLGDGTYNTRYHLGTALKELGEDGFGFYERLCKGYDHPRPPRQEYDGFPKNRADGNPGKITLATFFWIMREWYGIRPTAKEVRLPVDEINPDIADIVKEVGKVYQCGEDFAVVAMYGAVAAVAGRKFSLWDGKYINYAQIWAAIVAPSGTGKSEVLNWFFKPVAAIDSERYKEYQIAVQEWKEGGEKGPKPKLHRCIAVDTTPEVRDQILADNPNGLCLVVDELKGLFDDLGRYNKSGEVGRLLSNYSNQPYTVDRKTQEPMRIECPVLSIVGGTQPDIFPLAFGSPQFTGNGFLPRWCFVWNDNHPKRIYTDSSVNPAIIQKWNAIITQIAEIDKECTLKLSSPARALYESYYNELEDKIYRAKDDSKKEMLAKMEVTVLRWALITSILAEEYAEIGEESMEYAIACCRYFEITGLKAINAVKGQSPRGKSQDAIRELFRHYPNLVRAKLADAIGVSGPYITKVLK